MELPYCFHREDFSGPCFKSRHGNSAEFLFIGLHFGKLCIILNYGNTIHTFKKGEQATMKTIIDLETGITHELQPIYQAASVIDLLIDSYNLNSVELTESERLDLALHHDQIYNTLELVKNSIISAAENTEEIARSARKAGAV